MYGTLLRAYMLYSYVYTESNVFIFYFVSSLCPLPSETIKNGPWATPNGKYRRRNVLVRGYMPNSQMGTITGEILSKFELQATNLLRVRCPPRCRPRRRQVQKGTMSYLKTAIGWKIFPTTLFSQRRSIWNILMWLICRRLGLMLTSTRSSFGRKCRGIIIA